nr:MAG TPA: hypothetical protein [Caudoviricetes sp.]
MLIIANQLSVFCQNIPLTFDEATKTERTGFLASFLRQIKKNRREVDSWLIDLTNRGSRCLYHVRIFRDLYIITNHKDNVNINRAPPDSASNAPCAY